MDNSDVQLVGGPCGHHGPYTFYKAFGYTKNGCKRIVTLSEFFFVKMWRDSDLLCIGELQLLWIDKNSEQMLASLRLYFLPENTPDGRLDHGEDEVLAISEKVVIKLEDLITWITVEAEWNWGRLAKCEKEIKEVEDPMACAPPRSATGSNFTVTDTHLDYSDIENERKNLSETDDESKWPHVIILSFPKYCRYRAMMKRLEGVEDIFLKHKIVNALGGFYVKQPNTRVLFCKDTFDYPELEGHELLCNHLAPKLKGRPRGKRKKRSVSPCSESNESECSVLNNYNTREIKNGLRIDSSGTAPRRSTRCHENNENKEFVKKLGAFMKSNKIPMGRIPSLGYKELNLYEFYTKVQKLGGYDCVTTNRLWKSIFDDISGHQNSTSAATVIRRHYERFLLQYERHIRGETYKPLSVTERRRLKTKRGSSSVSDETESSSGTSTPTPSTSRKIATTENKENTRTEGKTSSLRSIRVKPERQKEKQANAEKEAAKITTTSNSGDLLSVKEEGEKITVVKPKVEKLVIKTESMTVKTECASIVSDSPSVKIEYAVLKQEQTPAKEEKCLAEDNEDLPLKMLTNVKVEVEIKGVIKTEVTPVKSEETPMKQEHSGMSVVKIEPVSVKPEKSVEPVTTAVTPVAQKINTDNLMSPMEGKENIPLIKTGDTATKNVTDVVDVPYKPQMQTAVADVLPVESDTYKSTFIHEVKKRKLDILKEGGLEVTPVRTDVTKDRRPSVIQQISAPVQLIPKTITTEMMPVPVSNQPHIAIPQSLNISQVKALPSTPTKNTSPNANYPFLNGSTPPKVVQSRSIYSYSEKTVYGNPKDILYPPLKETVHAPKFIRTVPRQSGGDPVDLSVNSPQKPIVEIMRVPQTSSSPYNRDIVTKNLYKSTINPIMDGRMLGPNLEITLVNPKQKKSTAPPRPYSYPTTSTSNPYLQQKRLSADYNRKIAKSTENGRFNKPAVPPSPQKGNIDINIPHPFKTPSAKPDMSHQMKPPAQPLQPNMKHFLSNPVAFPPYLAQLYEQAAKGIPPNFMPILDPTVYYTAAMQSLYAGTPMNSAPVLPMPTPEQFKLYHELMTQGRLNFPFPLQPDGSSPLKKM